MKKVRHEQHWSTTTPYHPLTLSTRAHSSPRSPSIRLLVRVFTGQKSRGASSKSLAHSADVRLPGEKCPPAYRPYAYENQSKVKTEERK
jgi:hypothetical protein